MVPGKKLRRLVATSALLGALAVYILLGGFGFLLHTHAHDGNFHADCSVCAWKSGASFAVIAALFLLEGLLITSYLRQPENPPIRSLALLSVSCRGPPSLPSMTSW